MTFASHICWLPTDNRVLRIVGFLLMFAASAVSAEAAELILPEGTEVVLKLAENITPRSARLHDSVEFVLAEDIKLNDIVVIPAGARAVGAIARSRSATLFGTSAVEVRINTLKAGDTLVPLHGVVDAGEGKLYAGQVTRAFVDADTALRVSGLMTDLPALPAPPGKLRVPNGKPIRLMLVKALSSKSSRPGDRIEFRVLDDIRVGDLVVIARGSTAWGSVTEVKEAGRAWRSGEMAVTLDSVALVDGQAAPIDFQRAVRGGATGAALSWGALIYYSQGLALFALPLAPLQHGQQAIIPKASVFEAYVRGAILLDHALIEAAQPKPDEQQRGPAVVTIYYPDIPLPVSAQVWCGSVQLGWLPRGQHIRLQLPPGQYFFRVYSPGNPTAVQVSEGADLYLRLGLESPVVPGVAATPILVLMDRDVGAIESADTKLVEPKTLRHITGLSTADLQAEGPVMNKKKTDRNKP